MLQSCAILVIKMLSMIKHKYRGKNNVKKEPRDVKMLALEVRLTQPQAKDCLLPRESEVAKNRFFHKASRGSTVLVTP